MTDLTHKPCEVSQPSLVDSTPVRWPREPFLAYSHLFGAAIGLLGTLLLASRCDGDYGKLIVVGVYGISLVNLFLASGLLHAIHCSKERELFFEKLDYIAIYLFIAGSYTPFCIFILANKIGYTILSLQWTLAFIGIYCTAKWGFACKTVQIVVFALMGWMFLMTVGQVSTKLTPIDFNLLICGGLFYTLGALIFAYAPKTFFRDRIESHAVWHVFVLLGATSHFLMTCGFMIA